VQSIASRQSLKNGFSRFLMSKAIRDKMFHQILALGDLALEGVSYARKETQMLIRRAKNI